MYLAIGTYLVAVPHMKQQSAVFVVLLFTLLLKRLRQRKLMRARHIPMNSEKADPLREIMLSLTFNDWTGIFLRKTDRSPLPCNLKLCY